MPVYTYIAKSQPQKSIRGEIEAESEQDAVNRLTKTGYFPILVRPRELSLDKEGTLRLRKISSREIVLFTRQLSSLIKSNVNILKSLDIIASQTANKYLKIILNEISGRIKDGKSLSESLAQYPNLFSDLYTSMVRSGEIGGTLESSLERLADFLEKEEEFKNSLRAALTYPIFVFAVGALTVVILLGFVVPRLVSMFEDMGQLLPLATRILINLSAFLRSWWWFVLAIIIISGFLLKRLYQNPQGRILWDRFKLKIAILGEIVLKTEVSRLMRTLSLLLSSGIPIIHSLDISTSVLENRILQLEVQKIKRQISEGLSFSRSLKDSRLFSGFVTNIIMVGEEAGALEKSLLRIADDYERETDRKLKTLTRLLEPIIILVMGLVVGFIVLSMLLPIFQINLIVR